MKSMLTDPPVGATPERLAWLQDQLASRMSERPIAGEIFRPRGAWGDRPMRVRRFALRHLGMGSGLHELERHMALITVAGEIAVWPLHELHIDHERRTVESKRLAAGAGTTATTMRYDSRIVVLRIQPPRGTALEIDVAHSPDCSALLRALVRVRGAG